MEAVSVALAVNKEIVIGFIYNPVLELLYTARKGRGAFVNDAKLKVNFEFHFELRMQWEYCQAGTSGSYPF